MKIVQATALDSIADYALRDAPVPEPGPGQVRIDVAVCGVGYVDALVSLGRYQVKPPLPHIPGQEVAGRVAALGEGVSGLALGDRVMATVRGGFAECALADAQAVWRLPERLADAPAAGFRINHLTALHGLRDRARLQPGETLVVLGAAGGVGMAAVQVGRAMGAQVIAVASTEAKRAYALAHGAHRVLDSAVEGWRERLKAVCAELASSHTARPGPLGPDVVFDPLCGPLFEPAYRSLAWGGRHLVVGFVGGPIPALKANLPLMKGASLVGVDVRQFGEYEPERARAQVDELLQWAADGRLAPPVGREFALGEFAEALNYAMGGQGLGKTVLRVAAGT
ncbi:NADPH:quinone oxidoreductase family protein [Ideonella sp. DXS22W]|uniref:NADPH:quinone oxidoreductase family protein n=1 Tax=Pseudaquabacterium inlustre TaxID=2984192 RepID=A0ABU9CGI1_9BURK